MTPSILPLGRSGRVYFTMLWLLTGPARTIGGLVDPSAGMSTAAILAGAVGLRLARPRHVAAVNTTIRLSQLQFTRGPSSAVLAVDEACALVATAAERLHGPSKVKAVLGRVDRVLRIMGLSRRWRVRLTKVDADKCTALAAKAETRVARQLYRRDLTDAVGGAAQRVSRCSRGDAGRDSKGGHAAQAGALATAEGDPVHQPRSVRRFLRGRRRGRAR